MLITSLCAGMALMVQEPEPVLSAEQVAGAAAVAGLAYTAEEIEQMLGEVGGRLRDFEALRRIEQPNDWIPATTFRALQPGVELRLHELETETWEPVMQQADGGAVPDGADLAFLSIEELGALLRGGQLTCVELTEFTLERLQVLDSQLHCVVSLCAERALKQARALDAELAEGKDRGPLHGIPWGAKDLLAVEGTSTTWGAAPYRDQVLEGTATVVERLDAAGAVLVAKLTLGALAMGDVWFGGTTRNPWNLEQGSSGSSAGPAAAVAAGGVAFAIGSETLGSIVSPSVRCGASSLRPSFGRVPRTGAMTLSWTMDKLGPMCRSARDAALVQQVIDGPNGLDPTVSAQGLPLTGALSWAGVRAGVPAGVAREGELAVVLAELEGLGAEIVELELPDYPLRAMILTLMAEASTAFDELTRSNLDDELVRQDRNAWPNSLRAAQLLPAVEYLRAQRLRARLCVDLERALGEVDVVVHPPYAAGLLYATNLTGQPTFTAPVFRGREAGDNGGQPGAICFTGRLFDDAYLMGLVQAWQGGSGHHLRRPVGVGAGVGNGVETGAGVEGGEGR